MSTTSTPSYTTPVTFPVPSPSVKSSRRTSLETATRSSNVSSPALGPVSTTGPAAASTSAAQLASSRRNRAALRDFYGLKSPVSSAAEKKEGDEEHGEAEVKSSELDASGFDANAYVKNLLVKEGLEGVLKTEGNLVSEIRSLDGDRKALVYDNYSKLITATDTIRNMRANMDPLTPTTSTLTPAIAHIAGTAEKLADAMSKKVIAESSSRTSSSSNAQVTEQRQKQIETVRWVTSAPRRYRKAIEAGDRDAVVDDWEKIKPLLVSWQKKGIDGTAEILSSCEVALKE